MAKFSLNNFSKRKLTFLAAGVLMSVITLAAGGYILWRAAVGWKNAFTAGKAESGVIRFEIEKVKGL